MEVYTVMPTPFAIARVSINIKTTIEEYERILIGRGFYGILFKNPVKNLWHISLENCGALIGTNKSRATIIKEIKKDIFDGDEKIMMKQIEQGISELKGAAVMERDEWFEKFKGES